MKRTTRWESRKNTRCMRQVDRLQRVLLLVQALFPCWIIYLSLCFSMAATATRQKWAIYIYAFSCLVHFSFFHSNVSKGAYHNVPLFNPIEISSLSVFNIRTISKLRDSAHDPNIQQPYLSLCLSMYSNTQQITNLLKYTGRWRIHV